jgi:hypothetical protein
MKKIASSFFENLFSEDTNVCPNEILNLITPRVTPEVNESLTKEFSDLEIADALFQIGPLKAPGPDGFHARFFQRNWLVLKEEITTAIKHFFSEGVLPEGSNDTIIALIPKTKNADYLKDFRPISLCNVVYKIISKCMVNRMRPLLDSLIDECQSAFIPGRLITDNALMAFECFHAIQRSKGGPDDFCALKLDLAKAYDRVDWRYLEGVLKKFGFADIWIKWIMTCVTSVRYQVKVNGELSDLINPTRGLRQGDPLSPYLFLFIGEGLTSIIHDAISRGDLNEFKICRRAPGLSHLLFADDSLLFMQTSTEQAHVVKTTINNFEKGT